MQGCIFHLKIDGSEVEIHMEEAHTQKSETIKLVKGIKWNDKNILLAPKEGGRRRRREEKQDEEKEEGEKGVVTEKEAEEEEEELEGGGGREVMEDTRKTAHWVKVQVAKPDDPSSIPRTYTVGGEN